MIKEQFEQLKQAKDELTIAAHNHFYKCIVLLDTSLQKLYEKETITNAKCMMLVKEMHYDIFFYRTQIFFEVPTVNSPWISHIPHKSWLYTLYDDINKLHDTEETCVFFKNNEKEEIGIATFAVEEMNWEAKFANITVFDNYVGWTTESISLPNHDKDEQKVFMVVGDLSKESYTNTLMHLLDPQEKIAYLKEKLENDLPFTAKQTKMNKI